MTFLRRFLATDFTISKRLLGLLMIMGGALGFIAILAIDALDMGREGGIGPTQRIALGGCVLLVVVGLTLLPLGRQPA
jgi:hypothetical protein